MLRLLSFVLLALVLSQAAGLPVTADLDGCAEGCPGEGPGGHCPPDCAWCACCPGVRPIVVEHVAVLPAPEWRGITFEQTVPIISTPYPPKIDHVPRLLA